MSNADPLMQVRRVPLEKSCSLLHKHVASLLLSLRIVGVPVGLDEYGPLKTVWPPVCSPLTSSYHSLHMRACQVCVSVHGAGGCVLLVVCISLYVCVLTWQGRGTLPPRVIHAGA